MRDEGGTRLLVVTEDVPTSLPPGAEHHASAKLAARSMSNEVAGIVIDVELGRDACTEVLDRAHALHRPPLVVIFGEDGSARCREWALRGAGLLEHAQSSSLDLVVGDVAHRLALRSLFESLGRSMVGVDGLKTAQDRLRMAMFIEAYLRCDGNKCATARMLGITRGAVQKIVRNMSAEDWKQLPQALRPDGDAAAADAAN